MQKWKSCEWYTVILHLKNSFFSLKKASSISYFSEIFQKLNFSVENKGAKYILIFLDLWFWAVVLVLLHAFTQVVTLYNTTWTVCLKDSKASHESFCMLLAIACPNVPIAIMYVTSTQYTPHVNLFVHRLLQTILYVCQMILKYIQYSLIVTVSSIYVDHHTNFSGWHNLKRQQLSDSTS